MKKLLLVLGALVLVPMFAFADASAVEKKDSPSEVLNKLLTATFKNFDYATAMALSHGWQKDFLRMQAKSMAWLKKTAAAGDAEAQAKLAKIKVKSAQFTWEIKDEKIDGDLAVVTTVWKIGDKTSLNSNFFMKVGRAWKSISPEDYSNALKARSGR